MKPPPPAQCDYSIQVLQRAMNILEAILEARTPLGLEKICSLTGLHKSTAFRIIANLVQRQYLEETPDGYWLGLKMLRFGALVEEQLDLKQQAHAYLVQLRDQVNETVHLAVMDNAMRVIYLEKLSTQHAVGLMKSRVGSTSPMHCTAVGKVMAAYAPQASILEWISMRGLPRYTPHTITDPQAFTQELAHIRACGYALDEGEHEESVRCIAAPVCNHVGEVVAAISVSGPAHRMPEPLADSEFARRVVETARLVSRALGFGETSLLSPAWRSSS